MAGQNVWTSSADGDVQRVYTPGKAESILDIAAAPNGQQVAVLVEGATPAESLDVLVVDSAGTVQQDIEVESQQAIATPVAAASAPGIDWSPQGDHLLVLLRDGNIVSATVGAANSPVPQTFKAAGEDIRSATWSPTGESIAYLAVVPASRSRTLVVESVVSGVSLPVVPPSDERSVVEFAWMPDGAALLFTEGSITGGAVSGVDLWRVAVDGTNRQLVASAGSVAPVARITVIRPSPDGRRVAYAVLVPGDDSPRFDSIWVRDLASRTGYEVATPSIAGVDEIWWMASGLLVLADEQPATPGGGSAPVLLHVPKDGVAEIVWRMPRPAGTPTAATPAATPVSS
ncbi:MAG: hypothetical protein U0031_08095 [Thermomicrobiales bacterium]